MKTREFMLIFPVAAFVVVSMFFMVNIPFSDELSIATGLGTSYAKNGDPVLTHVSISGSGNRSSVTTHSDIDSTPTVAVITISKDAQGNTVYDPQSITIKTGDEILILNNDTAPHTFTNGVGPDDQLAGKLFDTGTIEPRGFVEYVASNLQPGTYPFFSMSNPSVKGEIVVTN
jgi:plastocyanin